MELERRFLAALDRAAAYELAGRTLVLLDPEQALARLAVEPSPRA